MLKKQKISELKEVPPMKKKNALVQVKEIAQKSGVSQSTASIVLNGRGDQMRISKATQQKVWETARSMNYRPKTHDEDAGNFGAGIKRICILWNSKLTDDTMGRFFSGVANTIKKNKLHLETSLALFDEGKLSVFKDAFISGRYDGVFITSPADEDIKFLDSIEPNETQIVFINRNSTRYSCVYVDNVDVGKHCADLFFSRNYHSVGVIGSTKSRSPAIRRFGFLQECQRLGITCKKEWIQESPGDSISDGYRSGKQLLSQAELPEGLFILNDLQAVGVMIALKESGVDIPNQIKVLAYGSNDLFDLMTPKVASVDIVREVMAEHAITLLMTKLENNITYPISRVVVPEYKLEGSF